MKQKAEPLVMGHCPACRDKVEKKGLLQYKRPYLCRRHQELWDKLDKENP
jgi:hypothetical protein